MPQATITRRYRFCAAHRLHADDLSTEENWAIFGKCNNSNGHGHNYVLFVSVIGEIDPITHQVLDGRQLDGIIERIIIRRFDHRDLNLDPAFATLTTTGENLVRLLWDLLVKEIPKGRLAKVGVIETRDNYFEYSDSLKGTTSVNEVQHA
ncbi:MAG TPA: 6-carboxytetrahydropterin synthase [Nitrospira sp.]|jgi:6-pyruvoyltetrahydropterin/6-carboxytetrahydropterin synthase|nr:6-carboxytetrahydropterin synthase [Nitrospira sp.]